MFASHLNRLTFSLLTSAALLLLPPARAALAQSATRTQPPALLKMPGGGRASQGGAVAEADRMDEQARVLYEQGNYAEALPLMERALTIREQRLGANHGSVAVTLNHLGKLYEEAGELARAERAYRRAIEIIEKLVGPDRPEVVVPLSNLALLYRLRGEYANAERLLKQSIAILEKAYGVDQPVAAETLNFLAVVYQDMGDYARAEELVRRVLEIRLKAFGPDNIYVAQSLNNLALLLRHVKGDYAQAGRLLQRALVIMEKNLGPDHHYVSLALQNLADLYVEEGNYRDAEPLLLRSLETREKTYGPHHVGVARALNALTKLYAATGDYLTAEEMSGRARAIFERTLGPDHREVAGTLNNLAWLYLARGDLGIAEQSYKRALAINEKTLGPDHLDVARSLNNLAAVYVRRGDFAKAGPLVKRALEIRESVLGPDHPATGVSVNNLASLYDNQGDHAGAERMYRRALAIYEKAFGPLHPDVALCANNLALNFQERKDYARAEEFYNRALAIREKILGPDHPDTAVSLANLSTLKTAQHRLAEAVLLRARANDIHERNLTLMLAAGSETQKRLYADTLLGGTQSTISLHVNTAPGDAEAARLALTTILRRKGRTLDAMSDQMGALRRRLNPQDRALLDELSAANSRLAALTFKGPGRADPEQHRAEVVRLGVEKERLEAEVSRRSAEFRTRAQSASVERVRRAIPAGAALVEIVSYHPFRAEGGTMRERWGAERYVAYVLRPEGGPSFVDLGEAAPINDAVARLRAALRDSARTDVKGLARALDEAAMRPVRRLLGDTRRVFLSPDGALNLVPFGALVDERGRYLVEDYSITYLTSGRDLLRLQDSAASRQEPVVIANPLFDWSPAVRPRRANGVTGDVGSAGARSSIDFSAAPLTPLPGTLAEAEALRVFWPRAFVLTGAQATEAALKGVSAPHVLHVATHGFFLADQPRQPGGFAVSRELVMDEPTPQQGMGLPGTDPRLRSGLVLAGVKTGQSGAGEDGVLTAAEAAGLDLWGTKLVVLSACDTGVGEATTGEGVYGLRRALVLAGAESQVMSLWPVSDAATRDLMVDYYRRLRAGEGRTEALRQVQLDMLRGTRRTHPFFWAGFIQSGAWTRLDGDGASPG